MVLFIFFPRLLSYLHKKGTNTGMLIVWYNALENLSGVSLVVLCQNHLYNCSSRCFGVL